MRWLIVSQVDNQVSSGAGLFSPKMSAGRSGTRSSGSGKNTAAKKKKRSSGSTTPTQAQVADYMEDYTAQQEFLADGGSYDPYDYSGATKVDTKTLRQNPYWRTAISLGRLKNKIRELLRKPDDMAPMVKKTHGRPPLISYKSGQIYINEADNEICMWCDGDWRVLAVW